MARHSPLIASKEVIEHEPHLDKERSSLFRFPWSMRKQPDRSRQQSGKEGKNRNGRLQRPNVVGCGGQKPVALSQ